MYETQDHSPLKDKQTRNEDEDADYLSDQQSARPPLLTLTTSQLPISMMSWIPTTPITISLTCPTVCILRTTAVSATFTTFPSQPPPLPPLPSRGATLGEELEHRQMEVDEDADDDTNYIINLANI